MVQKGFSLLKRTGQERCRYGQVDSGFRGMTNDKDVEKEGMGKKGFRSNGLLCEMGSLQLQPDR